mmetsp:Transcript_47786/g.136022  ORF Transcript_47786/g.136022 Transcript_47786/m.136022 type:complete len:353 (-) Transcript_47786:826-1884(-)
MRCATFGVQCARCCCPAGLTRTPSKAQQTLRNWHESSWALLHGQVMPHPRMRRPERRQHRRRSRRQRGWAGAATASGGAPGGRGGQRGRGEGFLSAGARHRQPHGGRTRRPRSVLGTFVIIFPVTSLRQPPDAGLAQPLRRRREEGPDTTGVHDRLVLVGHRLMHHWAISVALDVRREPLVHVTPGHLAHSLRVHAPMREALELVVAPLGGLVRDQVDKGISEGGLRAEVHRHVYKVVQSDETLPVHHFREVVAQIQLWHVPQHDGRPSDGRLRGMRRRRLRMGPATAALGSVVARLVAAVPLAIGALAGARGRTPVRPRGRSRAGVLLVVLRVAGVKRRGRHARVRNTGIA